MLPRRVFDSEVVCVDAELSSDVCDPLDMAESPFENGGSEDAANNELR